MRTSKVEDMKEALGLVSRVHLQPFAFLIAVACKVPAESLQLSARLFVYWTVL